MFIKCLLVVNYGKWLSQVGLAGPEKGICAQGTLVGFI